MVSIANKIPTTRSATATSLLLFSAPTTYQSLVSAQLKKGDAIAVARIAGIQAAKKTSDLIPLAHPSLAITGLSISIEPYAPGCGPGDDVLPPKNDRSSNNGGVYIQATVDCEGKTGVEMEAMMAASVAGLTMYDMLKGVDKAMTLTETRVLKKSGGKSGDWSYDYKSGRIVKAFGTRESGGEENPLHGQTGASSRKSTTSRNNSATPNSKAAAIQIPQKRETQPNTDTGESANVEPIIEQQQVEETQEMPGCNHTTSTNIDITNNNNNTETNPSSPWGKQRPNTRDQIIQDHVLIRQHEIDHGRLVPEDSINPADDVRTILAEAGAIDSEMSSENDETYQRAMAVVKRGYVTANDLRNARIREWLKRNLDNGFEIPLGPSRFVGAHDR